MGELETSRFIESSAPLPSAEWKRKRKITTIAFFIQSFVMGLEYWSFFATLWHYISTLIETDNPKLIYSLTSSIYFVSGIILSLVVGRIFDKTRDLKKVFLIINLLTALGNIIYGIYFSSFFLIIGRLLSGVLTALKPVILGELARCYKHEELVSQLSLMTLSLAVGYLFGAAIVFGISSLDLSVGNYRITPGNAISLLTSIVFLVISICMYTVVSNLSKEFDMSKSALTERKKPGTKNIAHTTILFKILSFDLLVISLSSFLSYFLIVGFDLDFPIIGLDILNWTFAKLSVVSFSSVCVGIFILICFAKISVSEKTLHVCFLISQTAFILLLLCVVYLKYSGDQSVTVNNIITVIWLVMTAVVKPIPDIYLQMVLTKIVAADHLAFGSGIRQLFLKTGSLVSSFTAIYIFEHYEIFVLVSSLLLVLIVIVIDKRKSRFLGGENYHKINFEEDDDGEDSEI